MGWDERLYIGLAAARGKNLANMVLAESGLSGQATQTHADGPPVGAVIQRVCVREAPPEMPIPAGSCPHAPSPIRFWLAAGRSRRDGRDQTGEAAVDGGLVETQENWRKRRRLRDWRTSRTLLLDGWKVWA